jgi:hypothetical protein
VEVSSDSSEFIAFTKDRDNDENRPVYAGDVARAVEIACRDDSKVVNAVGGKIVEAGGPDRMSLRSNIS